MPYLLNEDTQITVRRGSVCNLKIIFHGNLTGCSARMQARINKNDISPVISLSTQTGEISIDAYDPTSNTTSIHVMISALVTATYAFSSAYFDIEIVPNGDETQAYAIAAGKIVTQGEITK